MVTGTLYLPQTPPFPKVHSWYGKINTWKINHQGNRPKPHAYIWCYHVPIFHPHFIISFRKSSEAWKSSVWGRKACFGEGLRETSQAAVLTYLLGRLYTNAKRHWKMCFIWHRKLRAPRPSAPPPQSLSHCQQWPFPPSLSRQPSLMVFLCPFNTTRWLDNQSDFIVRQWWLINNNFLFKQESSRGSLS